MRQYLAQCCNLAGLPYQDDASTPALLFSSAINQAKKHSVALIIDEYDCPLIDQLNNQKDFATINRELRSFYLLEKSYRSSAENLAFRDQ